jgi:hypothetical protein
MTSAPTTGWSAGSLSPERDFPADTLIELPVRIHNPTRQTVTWDTTGPRAVTFEYLFISEDIVRRDGLALEILAGHPAGTRTVRRDQHPGAHPGNAGRIPPAPGLAGGRACCGAATAGSTM